MKGVVQKIRRLGRDIQIGEDTVKLMSEAMEVSGEKAEVAIRKIMILDTNCGLITIQGKIEIPIVDVNKRN